MLESLQERKVRNVSFEIVIIVERFVILTHRQTSVSLSVRRKQGVGEGEKRGQNKKGSRENLTLSAVVHRNLASTLDTRTQARSNR